MITLIERMPMKKWSASSNGLIAFEHAKFAFQLEVPVAMQETLYNWVQDITQYRLHRYFAKKSEKLN